MMQFLMSRSIGARAPKTLHPVPGELPPGAQKPPECHAPQSLPIRDTTVRAVHHAPNPANCARLSREGRHVAADSPAPVPPSDAHLPDDQRPLRRSDPADFRTRKQEEPGGLPTPVTRIGR